MTTALKELNIVSYQTPMAHVQTTHGHSFELFLLQYLPHVSWILQLCWLIQRHPETKYTHNQFRTYNRLNW